MPDASLVRRDQLPLPSPYVEPRTETEGQLATIWAGVLSMDRVGVEDRYFDLGGDSFLAAIMFDLMNETFQIELPLALLAEAETIAALARRIDILIESSTKRDGGR